MQKKSDISMTVYRRIYRLVRKNIEPQVIAATVNLPLKTVQGVIDRFAAARQGRLDEYIDQREQIEEQQLHVYVQAKTRYLQVDITGPLQQEQSGLLQSEFSKILDSKWKTVALLMRSTTSMDKEGVQKILDFHDSMQETGRMVAILDPSARIEPAIQEYRLDQRVPIFGTVKALEDQVFSPAMENRLKKN
jgi:anti-anti-sigma regulatory factor